MRAFRWHLCGCDFDRPADRVIKQKVLCVCFFGPCFLYALVYFIAGATCWSGQTSTTPSLLGHVVGFCMHARAHTGLRSHVTFFCGKRVEVYYTSDSACASEASVLVGPVASLLSQITTPYRPLTPLCTTLCWPVQLS